MTIEEAKQKVNKDDEAVKKILEYIDFLEEKYFSLRKNYKELKKTSEAHREQVGGLYKELDER